MRWSALPFALALVVLATEARADLASQLDLIGHLRSNRDATLVSIFIGLVLFAATVAISHMALRRRMQQRETALIGELNELRVKLDRAETFLAAESQVVIVWGLHGSEPDIEGDISLVSDAPVPRRVLGFGSWLPPDQAQRLESVVAELRQRGEAFRMSLVGLNGRHLEAEGRAVTGRAVLRLRDVSGDRLEAVRLRDSLARTAQDLDMFQALLNAVPCPAWTRDELGRLAWVNTAYVRAVDAKDPADAMLRRIELLETSTREASTAARQDGKVYRGHTAAVLAGWRCSIDVVEAPFHERAIGIVFDVSDLERANFDLDKAQKAHAGTLDQLTTAVAIFDRGKNLVFHNAAYRQLWGFEQAFLDQTPSEIDILDRLRARRLLPEQADFLKWREEHLARYQALETTEHSWYLPDNRVLRMVVNPNPQGGITYLFDDLTKLRDLQIEYERMTRVMRETLNTLREGVCVFGSDGKLKLSNAAFAKLWGLDVEALKKDEPHVDSIMRHCSTLLQDPEPWGELRWAIVDLHDRRVGAEHRLTRRDGLILDCTTAPLLNGATLLTFADTTASVNVERALTERNQALLETEQLRNDFVHHVSYELRSPLTNIIGFIQLLGDGSIGSLNPKQSEYVGYVMKSSAALLAIINDILDLATIDTGALELEVKRIDVAETIRAAAEGVQDRIADNSLNLQIVVLPNVGSFFADPKRVRQILFNLLSNAIGFSSPGQTVTLAALRSGADVEFKVTDQGRGIPHDLIPHVFDRFHSNTVNTRHRGVGLGLSIVKSFVELHGGRVLIDSVVGQGTSVTCIFPTQDEKVAHHEEKQA